MMTLFTKRLIPASLHFFIIVSTILSPAYAAKPRPDLPSSNNEQTKSFVPLPRALSSKPPLPTRSEEAEESTNAEGSSGKMEPARRKFTTLTIAPNATSACFLPEIYEFHRQGKWALLEAGSIGFFAGLSIYLLGRAAALVRRSNKIAESNISFFSSVIALFIGSAATYILFKNFAEEHINNEAADIITFMQTKWPKLRTEVVFPQHVVTILDYLKRKFDDGSFDIEEARRCISALHEPGRVL